MINITNNPEQKKSVDNIIFLSDKINERAGGPSGYIANLQNGLTLFDDHSAKIAVVGDIYQPQESRIKKSLLKLLTFWVPCKKWRRDLRSRLDSVLFEQADKYAQYAKELDKYDFLSITCHTIDDVLFVRKYLNKRNLKAKLILMSHSPQPPSQETYDALLRQKNPDAEAIYRELAKKEKEAFYSEDIFLFPSKEAMEPYTSSLPYFDDIIKQKVIKFVPTGCKPLHTDCSAEELRKRYQITTPYVISYMGRHIPIKGYDLLKNIAKKLLSVRQDVTFLIGGRMQSGIPPLKHKNWVELGFVNPAEIFCVSDCFILPNRQTYFDLILLEALSMGTVVFASDTGGNKTVYQQTKAITLYTDEDDCVNKINRFLNASAEDRQKMKANAEKAYLENYTPDIFGRNYVELIKEIIKDV